ncbi:MAG TPA: TIGR03000 domain-containing protein [Gemmatales bacterium]|nr:TIGR03000 domain-containing protein [Gemmatales bacterium]HMP17902.1 TIGR03000 domain-containing protein [Gemmatales bacterium]
MSCHGAACTGAGCTGAAPAAPAAPAEPKPAEAKPPAASLEAPAKVVVSLPADAKLAIDGHATTSTSTERTFVSPALEAGKDYQYTITAEFVRDGNNVTETKVIIVRAGETTNVNF